MNDNPDPRPNTLASFIADLITPIGYLLGLSYPVLALSTGVRGVYQLFFRADLNDLGPALSVLAAGFYLTATIGFFVRQKWAWRLSTTMLGIETAFTLVVGTLSLIYPDLIGSTAWRAFGQDYGYFPLFQPLLGLVWLWWPDTRRSYGLLPSIATEQQE